MGAAIEIDLDVAVGEVIAVVGRSGTGKTERVDVATVYDDSFVDRLCKCGNLISR